MGIGDRLKSRVKGAGIKVTKPKPKRPASSTTEPKDETIQKDSKSAVAQAKTQELESEQDGPSEPKPGPSLSAIEGGLSEASDVDDSAPPIDLLEDEAEDDGSGDEPSGGAPEEVKDEQADADPIDAPPLDLLEDDPEELPADQPDSAEESDSGVELDSDNWDVDEDEPETEDDESPELKEDDDEVQEDAPVDADPEQDESEDEEEAEEAGESSEADTVALGPKPVEDQDSDLEEDSAETHDSEPKTEDATEPEGFLEKAVDYVTDHPMEFGAMGGSGIISAIAYSQGSSLWYLALVPTVLVAGVSLLIKENSNNRGETSE
jgi:hypothetical protein